MSEKELETSSARLFHLEFTKILVPRDLVIQV